MRDTSADPARGEPLAGSAGRIIAVLLGGILLGLGVTASVVGVSVWKAKDAADQRAHVQQAARQTAVNLVGIDYRNVRQGIDRVLSGMTGEIRDQYATQAKTVADTATKNQATSSVQSVRAGVVSLDGDSAEVIVAVTAVTTSPKVRQGAPRHYRFAMDLTREGNRWLVSDLDMVP